MMVVLMLSYSKDVFMSVDTIDISDICCYVCRVSEEDVNHEVILSTEHLQSHHNTGSLSCVGANVDKGPAKHLMK